LSRKVTCNFRLKIGGQVLNRIESTKYTLAVDVLTIYIFLPVNNIE